MEPTETLTVPDPNVNIPAPVEIAVCPSCQLPVFSGEGVTVTADTKRWHPECLTAERRKARGKATGAAA